MFESKDVKGEPRMLRISRFMHGITNPELIKRLHDKILKLVDEMIRITTSFLRGEVAAGNQEQKKSLPPWKQQEAGHKKSFKKGGFKSQQKTKRRRDRFTLLSKSPKEILAFEKGKFKAPPLMTTLVEKRNNNKFCEFHGEVGHNTDESMHLKRQIEELLKNGNCRISSSPYNGIIERPRVKKIQAVPSIAHEMLKFPIAGGVLTLTSSKIIPIECAAVSGPEGQPPAAHQAIEERIKVAINPDYPEQTIMIVSTLIEEGRNKLCDLLQRNLDVFAWNPADMTGVPRHVAEHRLNIREGCPPVRQKRRSQAADRNQAIQEEVKKLVNDGIMKEPRPKRSGSKIHVNGKIGFVTGARQQTPEKILPSISNYSGHRPAHKASIVMTRADFIVKRREENDPDTAIEVEEELPELWILFTDGSSCANGFEARLILTNLEGAEFTYALRFRFEATNNEAKYEALIA
nr:reverse transcriptase domain-containing protein [Tanacetum cinerariifolium]